MSLVRQHNATATVVTTPADKLDMATLLPALEQVSTLAHDLHEMMEAHEEECPICGHHHGHEHHHHEHDHECCEHEHHHHEHDHECCEHEHHHEHDHECCEHEHHHHDHDHECCEHEHHHHHHADEVFTSWGRETVKKYTHEEIEAILAQLADEERFGIILRAKGFVESPDGTWVYFDYVPGEADVRSGGSTTIGKLCVIGSHIHEDALEALFGLH